MTAPAAAHRPWSDIGRNLGARLRGAHTLAERMHAFIGAAWPLLQPTGVSWMGFYERDPANPDQLVLAAREPKPACSPIGLHGACGQSLLAARPLVVRDVADLGAGYIACDPSDRSEVVVPCLRADGSAWGVLDLDSHHVGCFSESDAQALAEILRQAALSA